jgi:hypothetical protein
LLQARHVLRDEEWPLLHSMLKTIRSQTLTWASGPTSTLQKSGINFHMLENS